jgi:DNA polymerase-4
VTRTIFHIDVNSAYLSWESVYRLQRGEDLDLRKIPSAVGGDKEKRHGIILAKSIPAKKYNIQTGESLNNALAKCPDLEIVPPRYDLYIKSSNAMVSLIKEYACQIQRYSIDECFVDITDSIALYGDPLTIAEAIRNRIRDELGFTVSIGISTNKLLAKMASDLKKPDAVSTIYPHEIPSKMWPLPVTELFMVGRATFPKLANMGIYTIGDVANSPVELLESVLKSHGKLIWTYANGQEFSAVKKSNHLVIKSIGNSTTLSFDADNSEEAHLVLLSLCEMVCMRLRDSGFLTRLVSVSIKTNTFEYASHQEKFIQPTDQTMEIFHVAKRLFNALWNGDPIRHLGVRVSEFCENDFLQLSIFDQINREKLRKVDQVLDVLRTRYTPGALVRGGFIGSGIRPMTGGVGEDDYPMMGSIL